MTTKTVKKKSAYHHGDLRTELLNAVRILVEEQGPENFSIADACKAAGVSTAAPYRHFKDKQDMLSAITLEGMERLGDHMAGAASEHARGSVEAIAAMGHAYVGFATREPGVFRLVFSMFNENCDNKPEITAEGQKTLGLLLAQVAAYYGEDGITPEVYERGISLWSLVHGIAFLNIDQKVKHMPIEPDFNAVIDKASRRLLS